MNAHFEGEGPFWGMHHTWYIEGLLATRPRCGWGENLPPRSPIRRGRGSEGAGSVEAFNGVGSVGGQALTGIAALRERVTAP